MDEDLLKQLAAAGDNLANSIMSAHVDGATRGAQIIKDYTSSAAKSVEEKAKAGAEVVSKASESTTKAVKEAAESASITLSSAFENISGAFKNNLQEIGEAFVKKVSGDEFHNNIKNVIKSIESSVSNQLTSLAESAGIELNEETKEKFANVAGSTAHILLNIKNIEATKPFDNLLKDGEEFSNRVSGSIKNLTQNVLPSFGISGPVTGIIEKIGAYESAADAARTFESSMISAAGASGRLNDMLNRTDGLNTFDQFASLFVEKSANIGNATNQNAKDVMAWQQSLMQIKGGLDAIVPSIGYASEDMDALTAAITVSAGAGLKVKDTLDMMTSQYMNFGTAAEDSIEDVAKLAMVAQDLEVPLEKIKGGVNSVVSSLIYYKDNTEAAVNITSRLGSSLKEAGMSPEAISKLTSAVAQNVAGMQLAQRAFLSQQAGGPGGLAGGYQIELLKQQGKLDEVQKMTEEALKKQFGGRVVTLDEAAQDEGAARQLAKQVQLATSGPTKVVDTEAQAFALFKAMKEGTTSDVLSGVDAINQAAEQGKSRIARQESEINKLNNAAIIAASNASLMAAENSRLVSEAFRATLENTESVLRTQPIANKIISNFLPTREQATKQAVESELVGYATPTRGLPGTSTEELMKSLRGAIGMLRSEESLGLDSFSISKNLQGSAGKLLSDQSLQGNPNFGTIIVETVCLDCNTKHAKEIAVNATNEGIVKASQTSRVNAMVGHAHSP